MPDDKVLRCDCGYEASGDAEAQLIDEIRGHARDAHGMRFSVEDALLILLRSELDLSRESAPAFSQPKEGGMR